MKKALLIVCLAFTGSVFAQFQSSYFIPGSSKQSVEVEVPEGFVPTGGMGLVWDFSNLVQTGHSNQLSFVSAANIFPSFPDADVAMKVSTDSGAAFQIFDNQNGHLEQIGLAVEENGQVKEMVYSDPKRFLPASINLGQSFQDLYKSSFAFSEGGFEMNIRSSGQSRVECDASGSLQLPGITYPSVIRLVSRDLQIDSTLMSLPGFPEVESQSEIRTTTWNWFANDGSGFPLVFSITADSTFSDGNWEVKWTCLHTKNSTTSNLPLTDDSDLKLYPTSTDRYITILSPDGMGQVDIFDTQGKQYGSISPQKGSQSDTWVLDVGALPPGVYHIKDRSKWRRQSKKLVFSKL
jgi:hypothetical protein